MSTSFAISTHLDRLPQHQTAPQSSQQPAAATGLRGSTPAVDASGSHAAAAGFSAMLGRIGVENRDALRPADAATPAIRPNLDALNRVLSHYAAQSAGVDTIISLVRS